jgi:hypothetical protein
VDGCRKAYDCIWRLNRTKAFNLRVISKEYVFLDVPPVAGRHSASGSLATGCTAGSASVRGVASLVPCPRAPRAGAVPDGGDRPVVIHETFLGSLAGGVRHVLLLGRDGRAGGRA